MSWWPFAATNVRNEEVKQTRPQRMTLTDVLQAGKYLYPAELNGVKIWGWSILLDGRVVAHMTASDLDLDEERKTAERMCFAYNLEFSKLKKE